MFALLLSWFVIVILIDFIRIVILILYYIYFVILYHFNQYKGSATLQ